MVVNIVQTVTRVKPMMPSTDPRKSPDENSLRITCHQSRKVTSPSAMARIINEEACEPELPPLEIINGTNRASTTALAISPSKKPMAVAASLFPQKKTTRHPPLFFFTFQERNFL